MVGVLVFANWGAPAPDVTSGPWHWIHAWKWVLTAGCAVGLGLMLVRWFQASGWLVAAVALVVAGLAVALPGKPLVPFLAGLVGLCLLVATAGGELREWGGQSWIFARQILPLLFFGVLVAGALLGRPGHEGLLPSRYVELLVGASPEPFLAATGLAGTGLGGVLGALWPVLTCLVAAVLGAGMYFATLTEVPIVEGLRDAGMGKGPALTLLLAGPAVSLPNLLVIRGVLGTRKTLVFLVLVVVMATATGTVYGLLA
jgi:hypothetical protein